MNKMPNILVKLSFLLHLLHSFIHFLLPTTKKPQIKKTQIKKPQIKNLQQVFETFDNDKDGRITHNELSISLRKMGIAISDADLSALIEAADVNGDGCVDAHEFEALYRAVEGEEEEGKHYMEEAFAVFDRDGDGFISEEELKGVLESIGGGHGRSLEECRRMIERVDEDGDGRVSFFEFQGMMKDVGICN